MLQHLPVAQPHEPLSHLHVGPQGHPALALAGQRPLAQPHLPVEQPQSPSVQAHPGPQVQGMSAVPRATRDLQRAATVHRFTQPRPGGKEREIT
jgi:hypothetical protein